MRDVCDPDDSSRRSVPRGVLAALRDGRRGVLFGVLRVDVGGGIKSESALSRRCCVLGDSTGVRVGFGSGVAGAGVDVAFSGDGTAFCRVAGMFSLSSPRSMIALCTGLEAGVANKSTSSSSAMLSSVGAALHVLLTILLCSISDTKGEDGRLTMLASISTSGTI